MVIEDADGIIPRNKDTYPLLTVPGYETPQPEEHVGFTVWMLGKKIQHLSGFRYISNRSNH